MQQEVRRHFARRCQNQALHNKEQAVCLQLQPTADQTVRQAQCIAPKCARSASRQNIHPHHLHKRGSSISPYLQIGALCLQKLMISEPPEPQRWTWLLSLLGLSHCLGQHSLVQQTALPLSLGHLNPGVLGDYHQMGPLLEPLVGWLLSPAICQQSFLHRVLELCAALNI